MSWDWGNFGAGALGGGAQGAAMGSMFGVPWLGAAAGALGGGLMGGYGGPDTGALQKQLEERNRAVQGHLDTAEAGIQSRYDQATQGARQHHGRIARQAALGLTPAQGMQSGQMAAINRRAQASQRDAIDRAGSMRDQALAGLAGQRANMEAGFGQAQMQLGMLPQQYSNQMQQAMMQQLASALMYGGQHQAGQMQQGIGVPNRYANPTGYARGRGNLGHQQLTELRNVYGL